MSAADRIGRLLDLVPYLQGRREVHISQVAEDFGVTPKQVLQDLEVLQFCGLPEGLHDDLFDIDLDWVREDGHISFRNAEVLGRPRRLRLQEATSLIVALEVLLETSGGAPAVASALAKLRDVLGETEAPVSVNVVPGDPAHLQSLTPAIEAHEVLEVQHHGRSGVRAHTVEPVRLRAIDGHTYLEAWSREQDDWRSYRLDRIAAVRRTGQSFVPRSDVPPEQDWFADSGDFTLELDPRAGWVTEYFPVRAVEVGDDTLEVTFPLGSQRWAVELVLRLGAQVRGISDEAIAGKSAERAREALAHYRGSDAGGSGHNG